MPNIKDEITIGVERETGRSTIIVPIDRIEYSTKPAEVLDILQNYASERPERGKWQKVSDIWVHIEEAMQDLNPWKKRGALHTLFRVEYRLLERAKEIGSEEYLYIMW